MSFPIGGLVDPKVFQSLQDKFDELDQERDAIRDIVQRLEKNEKVIISALSNAHAVSGGNLTLVVEDVETKLMPGLLADVSNLAVEASKYPYYRFNGMWARQMQDAAFAIVLCGWLGGFGSEVEGRLLPIERVGEILKVPVNLKDRDEFHLTIEEYLQGLVSLIDELARLARNSVILGNYRRPLLIAQFIKDVHAGFQLLNLKNDSLRRRSDSIKYKVREVEDVVYDLSLRNLLPKKVGAGELVDV